MDNDKVLNYFENSFLHDFLKNEDITDISYNGESLFYVSNKEGRKSTDYRVDYQEIKDFIRQLANLTEQQFSYASPYLDVTIGKYRLNAVHQSIGRIKNDERVTFSIRIGSENPKIESDSEFCPKVLTELFKTLIRSHTSIIISGITGTGKTEFQKYLISLMEDNARVIVIDNVLELENIRNNTNIDLTSWQVDEKNSNSSADKLIRNALRSNPDWLIVAEARGKEMNEVLNSAMTGIPIITTLHAFDITSIPKRMASMVMMNGQRIKNEEVESNVYYHFSYYVYLKKVVQNDGTIKRYISDVAEADRNGNFNVIYHDNLKKPVFNKIRNENLTNLKIDEKCKLFKKHFVEQTHDY